MSTFEICLPLWLIVMWLWIISVQLGNIHKTLKEGR